MNATLDKLLCKKHSKIFQRTKAGTFRSSYGRGFECGDGWFKIIDNLASQLDAIESTSKIQVKALIVKEKFGGLRFQCDYAFSKSMKNTTRDLWWSIIHSLISSAETSSYQACEECGDCGKLQSVSGWYSTLCMKCGNKHYGKGWK